MPLSTPPTPISSSGSACLSIALIGTGSMGRQYAEMLIKNARNTVEQSKLTAQLASGSSIKIETLETTWRTIVNGIDETRQIQERARKQRVEDQVRLEKIKTDFNQRYHMPDAK